VRTHELRFERVSFLADKRLSETCALEIRAIRPLAKGEEIFTTVMYPMYTREKRRQFLQSSGIACNCVACALPDSQSTARDKKIISFQESASTFEKFILGKEKDFLRAAKAVETGVGVITDTHLHCYLTLFHAMDFFAFMGDLELAKVVGRALMNLCKKYLGTSSKQREGVGATIVAYYVDNPKKNPFWRSSEERACSAAQKSLRKKRLQSLAATIVRNIESL
jgi:hypothetical protein